ncbi:MAG: TerC/Alx family metal homeostasis membrane protein [Bacteroidota bacterium]
MISSEHLIFAGFLLFIGAILALDLGIFDRKSHVVKFREALIWTFVWVSFAIGFYFLLLYFGDRLHGVKTIEDVQHRIELYKHTYSISGMTDTQEVIHFYRQNLALEYITGYLIEYMLSVDNVFVMILVFLSFGVQKMYYKRVLMWGIIGAVIMRFIFIFMSAALIQRFDWILYIFGGFLVITGIKMFLERNKEDKVDPEHHPVVKLVSRYFPVHPTYFRQHFWFRNKHENGRLNFTPLFVVLVVIEFTDVIFAVDSVPAIFSITQDPYIVFFSNIFAIMGLRSLFFVVAHVINMFRFLKVGLSVLLSFIGFKMLLHVQLTAVGFTTVHSLLVIVGILGTSIAASLIWPEQSRKMNKDVGKLTGEKTL